MRHDSLLKYLLKERNWKNKTIVYVHGQLLQKKKFIFAPLILPRNLVDAGCAQREREREITNARMQAVTPVPHEVTIGLSKEIPAA